MDNKEQLRLWALVFMLALVGGGSGTYFTGKLNPPRPDPFTGTEARQMEARIQARLSSIEQQHQQFITTVTTMLQHDATVESMAMEHQKRLDLMEHKHLKMMEAKAQNKADDAKHHALIVQMQKDLDYLKGVVERIRYEHQENRRRKNEKSSLGNPIMADDTLRSRREWRHDSEPARTSLQPVWKRM